MTNSHVVLRFQAETPKQYLQSKHEDLEFIGAGRSAFVFKIKATEKVIKVFFPPFTAVAKEEARIYRKLQGIDYFPSLYEAGENYLVIDYLSGNTFFDCLSKGIGHFSKTYSRSGPCPYASTAKRIEPI